jgi:regulator of sigma E protease
MEFLQYVLALGVTLGVLVSIHELGHFLVARAAGAQVVRFSIGFGPVLLSRFDRHGTEFVLAAVPLGGYVRILDERDGSVGAAGDGKSFERLSPWSRIAFALGGPAANFLLAFIVYWALFVAGDTDVVPVIAPPAAGTPAALAGLPGGREIVAIDGVATENWAEISMALAARLGDSGTIDVASRIPGASAQDTQHLRIKEWQHGVDEPDLFESLGLVPTLPPILGTVLDDGPAHAAGLRAWDRIIAVDEQPIETWADWVAALRAAPERRVTVTLERAGSVEQIALTPEARSEAGAAPYGFVGVGPVMREVSYGFLDGAGMGLHETAAKTVLTLQLLKKMVTGLVSTRNLSGPITIAKVAGDSARSGLKNFLRVLALLSISLGVLNLLPIPILDGGHVLFCTVELIIGRPVPDRIQALGMQVGVAIVGGMMLLAVYNDITRLF